jgi:hypothetical protein
MVLLVLPPLCCCPVEVLGVGGAWHIAEHLDRPLGNRMEGPALLPGVLMAHHLFFKSELILRTEEETVLCTEQSLTPTL